MWQEGQPGGRPAKPARRARPALRQRLQNESQRTHWAEACSVEGCATRQREAASDETFPSSLEGSITQGPPREALTKKSKGKHSEAEAAVKHCVGDGNEGFILKTGEAPFVEVQVPKPNLQHEGLRQEEKIGKDIPAQRNWTMTTAGAEVQC